ncbi:hypothetical protein CSA56_07765 [candidate division KSB3 bacterium]|uniref:Ice-binding protein C-terminal domain-containing protein n=1 Tax=candidate division KSB3 bacterium TaxID=2044937 RepID=A0A2G6KF19_9BACT|nr:MAG: hypothetical protein CSA56_07765 [candidate division KSB3 bacterium]
MPEPTTLLLFGAGLFGLLALERRAFLRYYASLGDETTGGCCCLHHRNRFLLSLQRINHFSSQRNFC